ncbi:hypothetical protein E4M02_08605 [Brevundimonas sp. S30B]|nr:hypothetical protein E4M01_12040 [Brevundimonas sp. MF30-B]TFW02265.1 hypothetical protein E4M02_08605 [Brevundimonas sp. S30B]
MHREFVDLIPREMEADTLYIAMEFATASHKCFCGCGAEVVTPLSPAGWQLHFDGETISLTPSVGSWSLPCKSHYWIRRDTVEWAAMLSADEIERVRAGDRYAVQQHFGAAPRPAAPAPAQPEPKGTPKRKGILDWITSLWR